MKQPVQRLIGAMVFAALAALPQSAMGAAGPTEGADFSLALPVDCAMGERCFVQQYPDRDPGPGARDHACGFQSYNGHDGTDIRLRDLAVMAEGVPVLAAAAGVVSAMREGMADAIRLDPERAQAIAGQECGNGLVIDHGHGWQTQYCHLRRGSLTVAQGDRVAAGDPLGLVGSSGSSEFPHLEFLVRKDGTALDPFSGTPVSTGGCEDRRQALWSDAAAAQMPYRRGVIIAAGFADGPIESERPGTEPGPSSAALVGYGRAINLETGDVLAVTLVGPDGVMADNRTDPMVRPRARQLLFTGKRLRRERWPSGRYTVRVELQRGGAVVAQRQNTLDLP